MIPHLHFSRQVSGSRPEFSLNDEYNFKSVLHKHSNLSQASLILIRLLASLSIFRKIGSKLSSNDTWGPALCTPSPVISVMTRENTRWIIKCHHHHQQKLPFLRTERRRDGGNQPSQRQRQLHREIFILFRHILGALTCCSLMSCHWLVFSLCC